MRKIIERIASENSYHNSSIVIIKNKKSLPRERSWSVSSNKLERNISTKTNSTAQVSDNSVKEDSESDDIDGDCGRGRIHSFVPQSINHLPDHLDICLQYWQDIIYPTTYKA